MKKNQLMFFGLVGFLVVSLGLNIFLAVNISNRSQTGKICGDNDIANLNVTLESSDFSVEKVQAISEEVNGRSGSQEDANCVMISLISNQIQDKTDEFKANIETLKSLGEKGSNPSLKFNIVYSLSELESFTQDYEGGRG